MRALTFQVVLIGLVQSFYGPLAKAQIYSADEIRQSFDKDYPGSTLGAYNSRSKYSFYKSSSKSSPITSKEETSLILSYQSSSEKAVYYVSSNSFSLVKTASAEEYGENNKWKKAYAFLNTFGYESNGIFHNDFFINSIRIGNAKKGLYKVDYTKLYNDYKFLATISLKPTIPTMNCEVVIDVPAWLKISLHERNMDDFDIDKNVTDHADGSKTYTYSWHNMPVFKEYPYSPSANHYMPHLVLVYEAIGTGTAAKPLMPAVSDLYLWYNSLVKELQEDPEVYADLVKQMSAYPAGLDQIIAVNNWVRDNVRYIAFEAGIAGFKPDEGHEVYTNRYGDCKGMANLCKNILIQLGYDARLAWIGTRGDIPYDYSIPSLAVDNHMIAAVKHNDKFVFLDPTETYGDPTNYAYRLQGRQVMIENGDDYHLESVPVSAFGSDGIERNVVVKINLPEGKRDVSIEERYKGEPKKRLYANYHSINASNRTDRLTTHLRTNYSGSFELQESKGLDALSDDVFFKYNFSTSEGLTNLGDELYVHMDPLEDLHQLRSETNRMAPWFFSEQYNRKSTITFEVPEGYQVSHYPEAFETSNDNFKIAVRVTQTPQSLIFTREINVIGGVINMAAANEWESGLSRLKAYYEDKVIITKK